MKERRNEHDLLTCFTLICTYSTSPGEFEIFNVRYPKEGAIRESTLQGSGFKNPSHSSNRSDLHYGTGYTALIKVNNTTD